MQKKTGNKGGMGMGGFMGAMNMMNDLQNAYGENMGENQLTQVKKPTTTVKKPIKPTVSQPKKTNTISSKNLNTKQTIVKKNPAPKTQTNTQNSANIQYASQNVQNVCEEYKQYEENPQKQQQQQQQQYQQQQQQDQKLITNQLDITKLQDIKYDFNTILKKNQFNDDFDLPIYDFSDKQNPSQNIEQLINKYQEKQQQYKDIDFKIQENTQRITDIMPDAQLFNNISCESVVQGSLGDCYLISSIGVLSEKPFYITRLFKNKKFNKQGVYQVLINVNGAWQTVTLDDYFPCNNYGPMYCKPKNSDIYAMLLEKAYAKVYKGYNNIEIGYSQDALKDLTGAVSDYIDIKKNPQDGWKQMVTSLNSQYVLTAASKENSENMVNKHCYGILQLKEVSYNNKNYQFVQIRNPYGSIGGQSLIEKLPQNVIDMLKEPIKQSGGILWMYYEDFKANFEVVTVSKLHNGYSYSFIKYENNFYNKNVTLIDINKQQDIYFSIHEQHARFLDVQIPHKHVYNTKRLILFKLDEQQKTVKKVIGGDFNCKQSCYFYQEKLEPGKYFLYTEVDGNNKNSSHNVVVNTYSEHPVVLQNAEKYYDLRRIMHMKLAFELVLNYMQSPQSKNLETNEKIYQNPQEQNQLNVVRKYGTLFGYVYIIYFNYYQNSIFYEDITQFIVKQNLTEIEKDPVQFIVKPQSYDLTLFKIGNADNCSHKLSFKSTSNFKTSIKQNNNNNNNNNLIVEQAIKQGNPKVRQGKCSQYTLKTNEGFVLVYQNLNPKVYKESITFKILENLTIVPQKNKDLKLKTINLSVAPGETYTIQLQLKNPANASSKYSSSYQCMI